MDSYLGGLTEEWVSEQISKDPSSVPSALQLCAGLLGHKPDLQEGRVTGPGQSAPTEQVPVWKSRH